MDVRDFFWGMYQEHVTHARQHEDQRERMTGAVAALSAVVVAVLTTDNTAVRLSSDVAGSVLLILGVYGAVFSLKHYERFRRHIALAGRYRNHLEKLLEDVPIRGTAIRAEAERRHVKHRLFRVLAAVRLHWLWAGLPLLIAIGGLLLILV